MSSSIFYPASNADDIYWTSEGVISDTTSLFVGYFLASRSTAVLFRNVNIEKGSDISECKIVWPSSQDSSGTCSSTILFNYSDSASIPSTASGLNALSVTDGVSWSMPSMVGGETYYSPDISTLLKSIVDRDGWSSGNSILLLVKDNSSTGWRASRPFNTGSNYIGLSVTWAASSSNDGAVNFSTLSCDGTTGAYGEVSISPMTSNQISGLIDFPSLAVSASGAEIVTTYAQGSMFLAINNDGLGGLSVAGVTGGVASSTIPAATASATAKSGNDGVMTMPLSTATGITGVFGGVSISSMDMAARTINIATGNCFIPLLGFYGFVFTGTLAKGICTLRSLACSSLGLNGRKGSAALGVKIRMAGTGFSGLLADGASRLRGMSASGTASIVSKGTASLALLPMEIDALATPDASKFSAPVIYSSEAVQ